MFCQGVSTSSCPDDPLAGPLGCCDGAMLEKASSRLRGESLHTKRYKDRGVSCQVPDCEEPVMKKAYFQRYRICQLHFNLPGMVLSGQHVRWCQQCGRFHGIDSFDGDRRSCRERLERHNNRRRRATKDGSSKPSKRCASPSNDGSSQLPSSQAAQGSSGSGSGSGSGSHSTGRNVTKGSPVGRRGAPVQQARQLSSANRASQPHSPFGAALERGADAACCAVGSGLHPAVKMEQEREQACGLDSLGGLLLEEMEVPVDHECVMPGLLPDKVAGNPCTGPRALAQQQQGISFWSWGSCSQDHHPSRLGQGSNKSQSSEGTPTSPGSSPMDPCLLSALQLLPARAPAPAPASGATAGAPDPTQDLTIDELLELVGRMEEGERLACGAEAAEAALLPQGLLPHAALGAKQITPQHPAAAAAAKPSASEVEDPLLSWLPPGLFGAPQPAGEADQLLSAFAAASLQHAAEQEGAQQGAAWPPRQGWCHMLPQGSSTTLPDMSTAAPTRPTSCPTPAPLLPPMPQPLAAASPPQPTSLLAASWHADTHQPLHLTYQQQQQVWQCGEATMPMLLPISACIQPSAQQLPPHAAMGAEQVPHRQGLVTMNGHLLRLSFKLFEVTPDQLAPHVREGVMRLVAEDPAFIESCVRPGCTHLTVSALLSDAERDDLYRQGAKGLAERLLQYSAEQAKQGAAGGQAWSTNMLVQLGTDMSVVREGQLLASCVDVAASAPQILLAHPPALLCPQAGGPAPCSSRTGAVMLVGRNIAASHDMVVCRQQGNVLDLEVLGLGRLPSGRGGGSSTPLEWVAVRPLRPGVGLMEFEVQRAAMLSAPLPVLGLPSRAAVDEVLLAQRVMAGVPGYLQFLQHLGLALQLAEAAVATPAPDGLPADLAAAPVAHPHAALAARLATAQLSTVKQHGWAELGRLLEAAGGRKEPPAPAPTVAAPGSQHEAQEGEAGYGLAVPSPAVQAAECEGGAEEAACCKGGRSSLGADSLLGEGERWGSCEMEMHKAGGWGAGVEGRRDPFEDSCEGILSEEVLYQGVIGDVPEEGGMARAAGRAGLELWAVAFTALTGVAVAVRTFADGL